MDVQVWLHSLVQMTLLGICTNHEAQRKELKRFCINCRIHTCDECASGENHGGHQVLKSYRYSASQSYAAVHKIEIQEHMDCSQIQAYTSNRKSVLLLNPIFHRRPQQNEENACATCMRMLTDPNTNHYCSLNCKLQAYLNKENNSNPPFLELQGPTSDAPVLEIGGPSQERRAERKRKGTPRRAPFSEGTNQKFSGDQF